jgi:DNA-directed RNA polymerase sigma subunit (sigma70/sigma32)
MGLMASLPLFPTDDGWPYPDARTFDSSPDPLAALRRHEPLADDDVDLDLLELQVDPHAYSDLTELEYFAVSWRYGVGNRCAPHSMKELATELDCSHAEARAVLGGALDKLRHRLME